MKNIKKLSELRVGEGGRVQSIVTEGSMRRRFLDVGFTPGAEVLCVGKSPLGDPVAFLVKGAKIAIRKADASGILIV